MKTTIKIIIFICLVCFCMPVVYGFELCDFEEHQSLPDTFHIRKADIKYYDDISSIRGSIRDSIENPKAYILIDGGVAIAIEKENKYVVFNFNDTYFAPDKFERKDINQTGSDELIIRYWHSSGGGGHSEYYSSIAVWDIDSYKCLLYFEDIYMYEAWAKKIDSDTEEILQSAYGVVCYEYAVELEKKQLTIQLIKESKNEKCIDVKGDKYIYKLTESGFVLDRKEGSR